MLHRQVVHRPSRVKSYRNHAKNGTHRRDGTHRRNRTGVRKKKQERHDFIVFPHPHRGDGTGCDLSDVYPRLGATATTFELYEVPYAVGPFDMPELYIIRAPLLSRTIIVTTQFTR